MCYVIINVILQANFVIVIKGRKYVMKIELLSQHEIQIQKKENIGSTFFSIVCSSGVQTPEKPL